MKLISPFLALIWGLLWALVLEYVPLGRFLAARRSWLAVVIGVAVDLLLLRPVLSLGSWLRVTGVLAASSVGMILLLIENTVADDVEERRARDDCRPYDRRRWLR